ncbi:bacterial proteasome activator family protein [Cellulomonas sp. zg-ZUI222]|uniref:Bacterial proteasome activator n=1 Tax=Cellulomonas wangleii TaxID=2816956 RepID=A0ABX8D4L4_9CELL|nr:MULTISPECIES: bacterial proteasome activator family protein [Cellulomonas]MBO0899056.1 bacterial proteasome activator family protein [Cellulomonas sp. zg-ZUI22]MBO0919909.1 bacterial proteasome activator family protein [Cellulomonas wangleii]MBO0923662.1 bacterial proteasome activator family protein [Cellulomonas wangleii]QVI61981.1 bacterial proteasome activator family protein [Cellulomonas wangleii]
MDTGEHREEQTTDQQRTDAPGGHPHAVVVPPQDRARPDGRAEEAPDGQQDEDLAGMVEQPAKVMRIGTMIKQLLDEVRSAPLDDAARARLAEIHERSVHELEEGLSPELLDELHRITLPFTEDQAPSDAELRIAQAQLVGWLEGLFHGIQTALVAQQMAAQAQLTQMRRALPPGQVPGRSGLIVPVARDEGPEDLRPSTGQYL